MKRYLAGKILKPEFTVAEMLGALFTGASMGTPVFPYVVSVWAGLLIFTGIAIELRKRRRKGE